MHFLPVSPLIFYLANIILPIVHFYAFLATLMMKRREISLPFLSFGYFNMFLCVFYIYKNI